MRRGCRREVFHQVQAVTVQIDGALIFIPLKFFALNIHECAYPHIVYILPGERK